MVVVVDSLVAVVGSLCEAADFLYARAGLCAVEEDSRGAAGGSTCEVEAGCCGEPEGLVFVEADWLAVEEGSRDEREEDWIVGVVRHRAEATGRR